MKSLSFFFLGICFATISFAQLTRLSLKLPASQIVVFADKQNLYSYDTKSFYIYKKDTNDFLNRRYICDTVFWPIKYLSPTSYYYDIEYPFCRFNDNLNGIIVKKSDDKTRKNVFLKTVDGGRNWNPFFEVPDTSTYLNSQVAFKDFNNFVYSNSNGYYHYKNGNLKRLNFTDSARYIPEYKDGIYAFSSPYNKHTYVSNNDGQSWDRFLIPSDTGQKQHHYFKKQYILNGKVFIFNITSAYTHQDISKLTYLTIIDPISKTVTQKTQSSNYNEMFLDRKENVFFAGQQYYSDRDSIDPSGIHHQFYNLDYSLYLSKGKRERH